MMAGAPYSRIFINTERTVAISGCQIYVLSSTAGELLSSTSNTAEGHVKGKNAVTGLVVSAAVNEDFTHLLSVGDDKIMKLWELPELKLVNERKLPKRPTDLAFTKDSQTILVSDKFGDVFSYPFHYIPPKSNPAPDELSSHENPSNGQLVLGHASPLNAFLLSHDERYIITADRDEHIRVSWYPQGYNIETYCLGHRRYVSTIHIPSFSPTTLISGGGDPSLRLWDWMSGQCVGEVKIWEFVEPFIVVKSNKRKRADEDEEGDAVQKRKGKGKKAKRRAKKKDVQEEIEQRGDDDGDAEAEAEAEAEGKEGEQGADDALEAAEEKVLVVSKIGSVQREDASFVVFSAVGATALFGFRYPTGVIEHIDFGCPVVDFTTDGAENIWVSLDVNRSAPGSGSSKDTWPVKVVKFGGNDKFVETPSCSDIPLLKSLNETGTTAGPSDKHLDFYADLKGMPKWSEPSAQMATAFVQDVDESVSSSATSKPLTRRKEARLKNKKNVLAKMRETGEDNSGPLVPSVVEGEKAGTIRSHEEIEGGDAEGREAKRAKSVMDSGDGDVEMHP